VAYNLIVASDSPVLRKLCQSVFPEGNYQLLLASNLDEVNRLLDSVTPEAVILEQSILDSTENALSLNNRLSAAGRVPVFLVAGTFEPLTREFIPTLRPEQVFHKPFYSESLAAAIKETIEKNKIPDTLPEELPEIQPGQKTLSPSGLPSDLRREVRLLVQEEIQSAEKELEEKIRQNLAPEIKALLSQQAEGADSHRVKTQGRKS
jgi:DNA-binding response OmpR family regulator